MNLCSLTMKSQVIARDDRPFSSVKGQVPHFKGLKGRRTVTYRNSLYSDDLDDPELVFDNNHHFRDECIIRTFNCYKKDAPKRASPTFILIYSYSTFKSCHFKMAINDSLSQIHWVILFKSTKKTSNLKTVWLLWLNICSWYQR